MSAEGGSDSRLGHAAHAADLGVGEGLLEAGHDAQLRDHVLEGLDLGLELARVLLRRPGSWRSGRSFSARSRLSSATSTAIAGVVDQDRRPGPAAERPETPTTHLVKLDGDLELAEARLGVGDDDEGVELVRHQPLRVFEASFHSSLDTRGPASTCQSPISHPETRKRRLARLSHGRQAILQVLGGWTQSVRIGRATAELEGLGHVWAATRSVASRSASVRATRRMRSWARRREAPLVDRARQERAARRRRGRRACRRLGPAQASVR